MRLVADPPTGFFRGLRRSQTGQNVAEYAIGLAILGGGSAVLAVALRADIVFLWARAARFLAKFTAVASGG